MSETEWWRFWERHWDRVGHHRTMLISNEHRAVRCLEVAAPWCLLELVAEMGPGEHEIVLVSEGNRVQVQKISRARFYGKVIESFLKGEEVIEKCQNPRGCPPHEFQDEKYGRGMRVHNPLPRKDIHHFPLGRCTVCGYERVVWGKEEAGS